MKKNVLVIAPHPDDETLGCGGVLLKHLAKGDNVYWLVCTSILGSEKFGADKVSKRNNLLSTVNHAYSFTKKIQLNLKSTQLDEYTTSHLISEMSSVICKIEPSVIYLPFGNDVHSDHRIIFDISMCCTKTFRNPYISEIYCYETLSETNFNIDSSTNAFKPNYYVDITEYLDKKLEIVDLYDEEMGEFPFPRNKRLVTALAELRGSEAGVNAAESFIQLKRISK